MNLETIREFLAKGKAEHPDLDSRMDKAAFILVTKDIEPIDDWGYWVQGESEPWYLVQIRQPGPWVCQCKDFERRKDWCKHGLAAALRKRCVEREGGQRVVAAPIPFPKPSISDTEPIPYVLTEKAHAYLDGVKPKPAA